MAASRRPGPARLWALAAARPVAVSFVVALLVRLLAGATTALAVRGVLIPDEHEYIDLATTVARGHPADSWFPGYGQALYHTTVAFTGPLAGLFAVLGPHRWVGQAFVAVLGAATAALAARLGREVMTGAGALTAGLVVALLPSQVLWSSVVLREAPVWAASAGVGVAAAVAARSVDRRALLACGAAAAGGLLALGYLRGQTLLVVAFALLLAGWTYRPARYAAAQRAVAALLFLLVPAASGLGVGGIALARHAAPHLADARANLARGAASAIVAPAGSGPAAAAVGGDVVAPPAATGGPGYLSAPPGAVTAADAPSRNLAYLPHGLLAVALRPFPWEPGHDVKTLLARAEDVLWAGLYLAAAAGCWAGRRRRRALAFPVLAVLGLLASTALTQGNLGTAFRHRSQLLWALAVLAAVGVEQAWLRRRPAAGPPAGAVTAASEVADVRAPGADRAPRVEDERDPVG